MCNNLHVDHTKIDSEGKAYKLVHLCTEPSADSKWRGVSSGSGTYVVDTDGWIRWKYYFQPGKTPDTLGFCFIPTLKGALETHKSWKVATGMSVGIIEVMYKQGLGRFMEPNFIGGLRIDTVLAKEFKILEEVKI